MYHVSYVIICISTQLKSINGNKKHHSIHTEHMNAKQKN